MQELHLLDLEGWRLALLHDMEPEDRPIALLLDLYLGGSRADILVTGHTHFERLD
jgi:predicted phosphodiesterase